MKKIYVPLIALALLTSGCAIQQMAEQQRAIEEANEQARQNAIAAQAKKQTEFYVVADDAWLCPTEAQAVANKECEGGKQFEFNHGLRVVGEQPQGEVWKAVFYDANGPNNGFVRADLVNELPDQSKLEAFAAEIDEKYPAEKRVPVVNVNYSDLMTQHDAMKGRKLIFQKAVTKLTERTVDGNITEWVIAVAPKQGAEGSSPALLRFENSDFAQDVQDSEHPRSYKCGHAYCDTAIFVGHASSEKVDRVDSAGNVKRLPVIVVDAYADRFGSYGSL